MTLLKIALAAALVAVCSLTHAQPAWKELPFAQRLNMDIVREVTASRPENLLASIKKHGVDIQVVRSETPTKPLNPLLSSLPVASPDLIKRAGFQEEFEGRTLGKSAKYCEVPSDTILIRDTALTYTLIHEFTQGLLVTCGTGKPYDEIELQFATAFRRLTLYQRRLFDDPFNLLNPLWRRDILSAQAAVADQLFDRIQMGQSQEAVVEKVLSRLIDEKSPYFDLGRRQRGYQFGVAMIDNSIDLFNATDTSVFFTRETIVNLREEIRRGNIAPDDTVSLSDDDVQAALSALESVAKKLEIVRAEIQELKRFYLE